MAVAVVAIAVGGGAAHMWRWKGAQIEIPIPAALATPVTAYNQGFHFVARPIIVSKSAFFHISGLNHAFFYHRLSWWEYVNSGGGYV